jgi:hypothetical protein
VLPPKLPKFEQLNGELTPSPVQFVQVPVVPELFVRVQLNGDASVGLAQETVSVEPVDTDPVDSVPLVIVEGVPLLVKGVNTVQA